MSELPFILSIRDGLSELNDLDTREIIGCTDDELKKFEEIHPFHIKLPLSYKEFMKNFGKQISHMQPVSAFFYNQILRNWNDPHGCQRLFNKEFFHEMFVPLSNPPIYFPENGFVFTIHEGYQYRFIKCNGEDDPITYFTEYDPNGKIIDEEPRYSELMKIYVNNFIIGHKTLIGKRPNILNVFAEFKVLFLDLLDYFKMMQKYSNQIEKFDRVYRYYFSINIYEVFNNSKLDLYIFYSLKPKEGLNMDLYNELIKKAELVESFYLKYLDS